MKNFPDWFFDKTDWQEKTLGDLGYFYGGLHGKTKQNFGHGNAEFITYMNVYQNTFASINQLEKVEIAENEKQNLVQYGDILFTQSSETVEEIAMSSVWLHEKKIYLNSFCMGFRLYDLEILNPQFAAFLFCSESVREKFILEGQGISRFNISVGRMQNLKIKIPPLETQKKIADYFTHLDNAINAQDLKLKSWRNAKKSLLQKIFSQEFYFTADNGEKYPAWQEKTLAEVCAEFQSGKNITADKIFENEKYPVYGGNGLRGYTDKFNREGIFAVIGRQGALCGNIHFVEGKIYFTEHAIVVCANEENSTRFLSYILETMNLNQYSGQTAQPGLAVNKLIGLKNKFPCLEEQKKIAEYFSSLDKIIDAENKILENLRLMKRGLLQKLFV